MDGGVSVGEDEFLYRVTHDLKSYMRAIRVIPEWVAEDLKAHDIALPATVAENFDLLTAYVTGMDRMLEGLTELSRVGRLADAPRPHDLEDVVRSIWAGLPGHAALEFDVEGAARLTAPANDLGRLVSALLRNAILFNDADPGRVRVHLDQREGTVCLRVADNGPGIDPRYHDRVFEPLTTLQPKDSLGTAGMGLAVARKVVTSLGGSIAIAEGLEGCGCAFGVELPAGGPA